MNLKTLTEQRADKQTEMETLLNKVEGEQRAFTDEENELFTQLETEINNIMWAPFEEAISKITYENVKIMLKNALKELGYIK